MVRYGYWYSDIARQNWNLVGTMAKRIKNTGRQCSEHAVSYTSSKTWHIVRSQDEKAFVRAADKYVGAHVTSKKKARSALQKMGIITPTGRLTKHYK